MHATGGERPRAAMAVLHFHPCHPTTGIWTLEADNPSTSGSIVYLFISCCVLKTIAFVIGDRVATWRLDFKQKGKFQSAVCCPNLCAWSEVESENSRGFTEWLKFYDHATKTYGDLSNDNDKVKLNWTFPELERALPLPKPGRRIVHDSAPI